MATPEEIERSEWIVTPRLRWFRPARGGDPDVVLHQLWKHPTGPTEWRPVPIESAD